MKATNVNKKHLCHFIDEYKSLFVSAQWRTLVLGWWCIQIIQSQTRSASNLQWCGSIYHLADVWGLFSPQVQVLEDAVYNCDNDAKQLVQESLPMTSTHLNCSPWINLSDVVRYGVLGQFSNVGHPLYFFLLNMQCWCRTPWGTCLDSVAVATLGKCTKALMLSPVYTSLVTIDSLFQFFSARLYR